MRGTSQEIFLSLGYASPVITAGMIAEVISARTGIPVRAPGREERDRLLSLDARLKSRVIGQNEAIIHVAQAIQQGFRPLSISAHLE